jgi:hypothetical protein
MRVWFTAPLIWRGVQRLPQPNRGGKRARPFRFDRRPPALDTIMFTSGANRATGGAAPDHDRQPKPVLSVYAKEAATGGAGIQPKLNFRGATRTFGSLPLAKTTIVRRRARP